MNTLFATVLSAAAILCMTGAPASAATATFDTFPEGFLGNDFEDGGIHFFNPDNYIPGQPATFGIDRADGNLGGSPFFSSPNGLALDGISPGPVGGGSRFGSMTMELADGGRANAASLDLFVNALEAQNRLILVALLGGTPVAYDVASGPISCCDTHVRLEIAGVTFDRLRLFGVGPSDQGAAFLLIDNVSMSQIPLPPAGLALASAIALLAARRRARPAGR